MVDDDAIINLSWFLSHCTEFEIYRSFVTCLRVNDGVLGFITGMSNPAVGIDTTFLCKPLINLAASSQDLFFDYELAKFALSIERIREHTQCALIGLHYMSFEYDLSLSALRQRVLAYYPFVRTTHHYDDQDGNIQRLIQFEQKARSILQPDHLTRAYDNVQEYWTKVWRDKMERKMGPAEIDTAESIVAEANRKNYPETVAENRTILGNYIEYVLSLNIRPIIVVCPMSTHYHSGFSPNIRDEFHHLTEDVRDMYGIEIFDHFDSTMFNDADFYDVMHLNRNGAEKFTELLNYQIWGGCAD